MFFKEKVLKYDPKEFENELSEEQRNNDNEISNSFNNNINKNSFESKIIKSKNNFSFNKNNPLIGVVDNYTSKLIGYFNKTIKNLEESKNPNSNTAQIIKNLNYIIKILEKFNTATDQNKIIYIIFTLLITFTLINFLGPIFFVIIFFLIINIFSKK